MAIVYCMLRRCIRNLDGRCKRTVIRITDGKCDVFRPRLREKFDATIKIVCDTLDCPFNKFGLCSKKEIYVTEKGCRPKESG